MVLQFDLVFTKFFLKQFKKLNKKEKNLINSKLILLKSNPFRFKSLKSYKNSFEIKISIENSYCRLIYVVYLPKQNQITIFGIFKREKDFKDFKRKFENEFN